ncbi:hypothetical protein AGABI1DRAFT_115672 [Agaricus bisporus var. burnettii JB137-S8]|uniref:BTB domain-containing protein n=1 Tax=Agaricus bisporus var. burnettii (strain JB137-S8 / ATCC MYA-4627 / FGSC 10392) TaxID=597362 RepID=K5X0X4_AGABU|nr:uncharacterized protein AGABI1DRAFT_115672 [Agaricus bisporus var. burnettii JB137-S8]EKM76542.1 hypothetical protein AGABI1DRAFT_115672 [Agaricus bisporus var. burnettii JB137-S8]
MEPAAPPSVADEPIVHNDAFYFDHDPMVVFLIENQLFKVHRYYFIKGSEFFRNLFAEAGGGEASATEGISDEHPIPLPGVSVKEFKTLLRFFYAMAERIEDLDTGFDLLKLEIDEQLALLSISHRFMFDNIFKYMLRVICPGDLHVLDRIRFGDKYELREWLLSAYETLLDRTSERLTEEEISLLGLDRVVRLLEAKLLLSQERLENSGCYNCRHYKGRSTKTIKDITMMYFPDLLNLPPEPIVTV